MRTMRLPIFQLSFAITLFWMYSCVWGGEIRSSGKHSSLDPQLNIITAVNIALKRAMTERGKEAKEFYIYKAEFDPASNRWIIVFTGRETRLEFESCFRVFVDDTTNATDFRACP